MISLEIAEQVHNILIKRFGGTTGIRDVELIQSALSRPFQTFDGRLLYPDVLSQAAALIESIVTNHPFIDGNKRTGYVLTRLFLINNNLDIDASEDDKYAFVIDIAAGNKKYDEILEWLKNHSIKL